MSFSFDSLFNHDKCTATEHAENNRDTLVTKKKACEAAKFNSGFSCDSNL